jgi:peptide deformylase
MGRAGVVMAIRDILVYPNPDLKKVSKAVELNPQSQNKTVDAIWDPASAQTFRELIADLEETLYVQPGCVGIAAPQIGALVRIVIIDSSRNPRFPSQHGKLVLINPIITSQEGAVVGREGCLSLPDFTGNVSRAQKITVEAQNIDGQKIYLEAQDFEARLILHECDHLDGILFIDRVSSLKTDIFRRKIMKPVKSSETVKSPQDDQKPLSAADALEALKFSETSV